MEEEEDSTTASRGNVAAEDPTSAEEHQQQHQEEEDGTATSPSLPWFLEYWSASFFQTPVLGMDSLQLLCGGGSAACGGGGVEDGDYGAEASTTPTTPLVHNRSGNSHRLRKVVASSASSLDGSGFFRDYSSNTRNKLSAVAVVADEGFDNDDSTSSVRATTNRRKKRVHPSSSTSSSSSPTRGHYYYPSIKKASMLIDKNDHTHSREEDDNGTDDGPERLKPSCSSLDLYSSRMLYTCDSFGYMADSSEEDSNRVSSWPPLPSSQQQQREQEQLPTATEGAASTRRYQPIADAPLTAPSSPGNETVTTISLTQSYMREFENDSDDSDSDEDEGGCRGRSLHQRGPIHRHHYQQSPFRNPTASILDGLEDDDDEEEEDEEEEVGRGDGADDRTATMSATRHVVPAKAYKYLIRMKPQNYIHHSSMTTSDMSDYYYYGGGIGGGGVEEEKKEDPDDDWVVRSVVDKGRAASSFATAHDLSYRIAGPVGSGSCSTTSRSDDDDEGEEYNGMDAVFVSNNGLLPCMPE